MKTALDTRYSTFEFIVHNLLTWYSSGGKPETDNDLSVLKVLKLLFFVSAVNANKDEHSILLEDIFSDYAAMPYGHVESRIYDYIKSNKGKLRYFSIDNHRTIRILDNDINNLREEIGTSIQNEVEQSITALKERNFSLIYYSAFDLVELSHAWFSWRSSYSKGVQNNLYSSQIPISLIKSEDKIFKLQAF